MTARVVFFAAMLLSACVTEPPEQRRDVSNQGTVCLDGAEIKVDFGTCLSSSCNTLVGASCTASIDADTITVTSVGEVVTAGGSCTNDCRSALTQCDVTGGDASMATKLNYGGQETTDFVCLAP